MPIDFTLFDILKCNLEIPSITNLPIPISKSNPPMAPKSFDNKWICFLFISNKVLLIFKYSVHDPSFNFWWNRILNPLTIAVLKGGKRVGWRKYKILATAGPRPFIFKESNLRISSTSCLSLEVWRQELRNLPKALLLSSFSYMSRILSLGFQKKACAAPSKIYFCSEIDVTTISKEEPLKSEPNLRVINHFNQIYSFYKQ